MPTLFDAHVHFWDPRARHHDWLASFPSLQRRFDPGDLDAGPHELEGAVFVQADCRDHEAFDEVRWVTALAGAYPFVRGIVAYAPLHLGSAAKSHLRALTEEPLVVGVRRVLQGHAAATITDPKLVAGLRLLPELGFTFDLVATHTRLRALGSLVRSCPETTFVLDHLGKPPVASGQLDPWRSNLARLAACPNVVCKLSGLATEAGPGWQPVDLRPYLEHALTTFGPDRCMFASDWPVATLQTSYGAWVDVVLTAISGLPPADQEAVLRGTAARTYGLQPLRPADDRSDEERLVQR